MKVNISTFIPKVMTPFQWDGQDTTGEIEANLVTLNEAFQLPYIADLVARKLAASRCINK